MRILDWVQDGTVTPRLATILAAGAVLWIAWMLRTESSFWSTRLWSVLQRAARPRSRALGEVERLRQAGAI